MGEITRVAESDRGRDTLPAAAANVLTAATAAWLVAIPSALVSIAAVVLLGPPLATILFPESSAFTFWPNTYLAPEPTEQARYVVALAMPIVLSLATAALVRAQPALGPRLLSVAVWATQLLAAGVLVICMVQQYQPHYSRRYLSPATLIVSAVIAVAIAVLARRPDVRRWIAPALRDTARNRRIAIGVAVAITALSVLPGVNSDFTILSADTVVSFHVAFPLDEAFAVVNGLTPLADFTAQYSNLWPYVGALVLVVGGKGLLAFTIAMAAITAAAMLAIFDVLRRVTRSPLAALALFLPFLATSFFLTHGTLTTRFSYVTYLGVFPLRYAGPFILAWLTARHLDRGRETAVWPLFAVGGLVLINNVDFGVAAFGATMAALVWTSVASRRRSALRLAAAVVGGATVAIGLVAALTLVRAGSFPHLSQLLEHARVFTAGGFNLIPLPGVLGLPLIIFGTYAAAIATATVRALDDHDDPVLTGMLAWSGVFGLGSATYYLARSHPEVVPMTFSAWALALVLLTVVVVRRLAAKPSARPSIAALLVLAGFGVTVCSLPQTPLPWNEVRRLAASGLVEGESFLPPTEADVRRFLAAVPGGSGRFVVRPGAAIALLSTTGHRIADDLGVVNVSPYTGIESINTVEQLERVIDALRGAGGTTLLLPAGAREGFAETLERRGFQILTQTGPRPWRTVDTPDGRERLVTVAGYVKWIDGEGVPASQP